MKMEKIFLTRSSLQYVLRFLLFLKIFSRILLIIINFRPLDLRSLCISQ